MVAETVAIAVWAMLPAYVPNNVAVLAGGGRPIDGGRTLDKLTDEDGVLYDENRILGDGKTWRGTAFGTAAGVVLALLLNQLQPFVAGTVGVPQFPIAAAVALAFGAMLGDILASFLKRRTGRQRGAAFPGVDQLDFVIVSLALTAIVATGWFLATFTLPVLVAIFVLTPVLHVSTNGLAYAFGLKDEPW
ncbi:CDP-2,3-bis-(O-geranylgeranyl)-sn-glycerol synthase [Natronomonas pharaonis DSM 2160]|uniref:CDP-archaeol synthase n=1 Tax=Natronomonas pharaonis (strain ATCC 35678 / DSM 2160 / CIP 103997 / JCM 8858 / NBRC 14720 / NCIMB 2260 / Gabara) TaxID=348780 RepID=CDPAS_NATPD|nr:CDP-2,3-bis-(O-geranylgeranyl)-sn-glycerol synthase [Natronomonas pharaonis]Q3ITE8.1 RecName: Full=CDP-archaeol synthase; AltName: Full=CDP-2,3-bis-(O-geranylgeranyl)-sn-glycerol synthase [Natronomonas pharaonis DSM 2160]CAI48586.1 CDP-2,3-bis-(O-geranylgeranyl)-sn-glycerol synthase [Natronomonas pharaonis DSM 2160]